MDCSVGALVDLTIDNSPSHGGFDLAEILDKLGFLARTTKMVVDVFPGV